MTQVLGRTESAGPTGQLGTYRARDGSNGAQVDIDLAHPHAGLVVGKRGSGKSHTLGVLAEELADAEGVTPIICDPMGTFSNHDVSATSSSSSTHGTTARATVVRRPSIRADALSPRTWCDLLDLSPSDAVGALIWHAATSADTLDRMRSHVVNARADRATRRAAANHLDLAAAWGAFDDEGLTADDLLDGRATVLDLAGMGRAAANAVVRGVAESLYDRCVEEAPPNLPWLLVDEAHVFFDGVAEVGLRTLLTRGRQPGVSLVAATQRPAALPSVAVSQADLLVAHRLTSRDDREALARARPAYMRETFKERMPTTVGAALVVDDATESVHAVQVRKRRWTHGGSSASASARATTTTTSRPEAELEAS